MKILYVEPLRRPKALDIDLTPDNIYALLETDIYERCWFFDDDVCLLCDECGWLHDYQLPNRKIKNSIIKGPFILVKESDEDYESLSDEEIIKYCEMFKYPERFSIKNNMWIVAEKMN